MVIPFIFIPCPYTIFWRLIRIALGGVLTIILAGAVWGLW